jgi:hypothetical protein
MLSAALQSIAAAMMMSFTIASSIRTNDYGYRSPFPGEEVRSGPITNWKWVLRRP